MSQQIQARLVTQTCDLSLAVAHATTEPQHPAQVTIGELPLSTPTVVECKTNLQ